MTPWRQLPANASMSTIILRSKFRIAAEYFGLPENVREAAWKSAMEDRPKAERIYEAIGNSLSYPSTTSPLPQSAIDMLAAAESR